MLKTKYLIIGGGLSGLIMGLELTKRGEDYLIVEKSEKPIDAKLHYLHADLSQYFPFQLREIDIATNWLDKNGNLRADRPDVGVMNHFSWVTTDKVFQNSMKFIDGVLKKGWIPESGIEHISELVTQFNQQKPMIGCEVVELDLEEKLARIGQTKGDDVLSFDVQFEKVVSTIPLPFLLNMVKYDIGNEIAFGTEPLKMTEIKFSEQCYEDLFQIVYLPYADHGYSRISILGNRIVAEKANGQFEATEGENRIGLKKLIKMMLPNCDVRSAEFEDMINWYGRYIPIEEQERAKIISNLESSGVICLGRYAEWTYRRTDHVVKLATQIAEAGSVKKGTINV